MTRRSIIVGVRRWERWAKAKARALLNYAGHQHTWCYVGLMSLAGHGPKHGPGNGQRDPVLYKGVKCVNNAARPPEGGPVKTVGLSTSSLPLLDNACWG